MPNHARPRSRRTTRLPFRAVAVALAATMATVPVPATAQCTTVAGLPATEIRGGRAARITEWARALRPIVAGRRVVMLGEPSHGDGRSIAIRAELVEALHRHLGFDVLVFEGDFHSLTAGWDAVPSPAGVAPFLAANLYPFWSREPAAEALVAYVARMRGTRHPLDIAGMDIRLGGERARTGLRPYLAALGTRVGVPLDSAAGGALDVLLRDDIGERASPTAQRALQDFATRAARALPPGAYDRALLASVAAWPRGMWGDESRDVGMAANLRWLADHRFRGRRLIVWAHSNHVIRDAAFWASAGERTAPRHVGNLYAEGREGSVASLGTIAAGGRISAAAIPAALRWQPYDRATLQRLPDPAPESIEARVAAACTAPVVLRLDRTAHDARLRASAVDYAAPMTAAFGLAYDALIHIGSATGLAEGAPPDRW